MKYNPKEIEMWKFNHDYPEYLISSFGRVYSFKTSVYLKPKQNQSGYLRVSISNKNKCKQIFIHKLVLETFDRKRKTNEICRHYPDQNILNNKLSNISWDTPSQNMIDRIENNTNVSAKLTIDQVKLLKEDLKTDKFTYQELREKYGIAISVISRIRNGKVWKTIGTDLTKSFNKVKKNKHQKLTVNDVKEIQRLLTNGEKQYDIAKKFKIDQAQISRIKNNKAHV